MSTYVLLACGFGTGLAIAIWGIFDTLKHSRRESQEHEHEHEDKHNKHAHSAGDKPRQ
jgi:hypothetical protein